jgi:hypothetical protein
LDRKLCEQIYIHLSEQWIDYPNTPPAQAITLADQDIARLAAGGVDDLGDAAKHQERASDRRVGDVEVQAGEQQAEQGTIHLISWWSEVSVSWSA